MAHPWHIGKSQICVENMNLKTPSKLNELVHYTRSTYAPTIKAESYAANCKYTNAQLYGQCQYSRILRTNYEDQQTKLRDTFAF